MFYWWYDHRINFNYAKLKLKRKYNYIMWYIPFIYFIFFSAYVELHPGLTNIWYRVGVDGIRRCNFSSYWHFLTRPFYMIELWYPRNWDINFFIGLSLFWLFWLIFY